MFLYTFAPRNTGYVSVPMVCSIELILNCYNIGTVTATGSDADISGICGYNFGPIKNCYYLADTEDENGGKTAAQFASGEIAYLLSQGCSTGEGDNTVTYDGSIWVQPHTPPTEAAEPVAVTVPVL